VAKIASLLLAESSKRLHTEKGIAYEATDAVVEHLLRSGGFDPALGARPMRQTVQRLVEGPLAERILAVDFEECDVVRVDGCNGVYAYEKETCFLTQGLPIPGIKVIETTGAGDALGSGFTAGLVKGYSLDKALSLGMYNAESVIRSKGAKTGLLSSAVVEAKLASCERVIIKSQLK
jgi:bifunctional ADP-heptose synthase (sugar kinase/adenylyltransferase)